MLFASLVLGARIDVHDGTSEDVVRELGEAADAGSQDIRGCGWGWAAMRVVVDGRGTTVEQPRGSSEVYVACVTTIVTGWRVMVVDGEAMLFVEANQEDPAARSDRQVLVTVLRSEGVEAEALKPLIAAHQEAIGACQTLMAGDTDYSTVEVSFGQREGSYRAWANVPGPMGRCVEREVEAWKLSEGSGKIRVQYGKEPSINSLLGP